MNRGGIRLIWLLALALCAPAERSVAGLDDASATVAPSPEDLRAACDYGIAVAFHGDLARAESVFVRMLVLSPGDPRALTNLGNLNLMRGEAGVALAFYEHAAAEDTTDAGILLNQATALFLLGENEAASERAAGAIERAGGVQAAARLIGLRAGIETDAPKAASGTRVSQEEILSLMRNAAKSVPADSLRGRGAAPFPDAKRDRSPSPKAPVWRAAGARAGDQDVASILCWKR